VCTRGLTVFFNTADPHPLEDRRMMRPDIPAAEQFIAANARVLDRRRYERQFNDGDAAPVLDALRAYGTPDGGFGYALEPDARVPDAQPLCVETALRFMDDADAWDESLVLAACDWLAASAPAEGGAVAATNAVSDWPRAPWWAPEEGLPASPITTGQLLGVLLRRKVAHPWCERAVSLMWTFVDRLDPASDVDLRDPGFGYQMRGIARFLDVVGEAARAEAAVDRLAPLLTGVVALDPEEGGETQRPFDFSPHPDGRLRRLFGAEVIEAHQEHLAAAQAEDGGWTFSWPAWSPVAEAEWRGTLTVDALHLLRVHGRLP
jgi:hypothetical protein